MFDNHMPLALLTDARIDIGEHVVLIGPPWTERTRPRLHAEGVGQPAFHLILQTAGVKTGNILAARK